MASLEDKVRRLLDLLDEVEHGFQEEPESIQPNLALHLLDRLQDIVEVIAGRHYDDGGGSVASSSESRPVGSQVQLSHRAALCFRSDYSPCSRGIGIGGLANWN